ncbi:MAG: 3-oxoacyl-[acyl-carrier-protein] reductase [Tissierellia bacterium]|nr:3-oxoacyl-[acyl-carrier-protein] reductase [Tissierellia bacterium]
MQKVAVITGGCRGIGRAMALKFAGAGYDLALITRNLGEACEDTKKEVDGLGVKLHFYQADVAREEEVVAAFSKIKEDFGEIYVLINNAGITRDGSLLRMKGQDFSEVIDTNLTGSFFCSREALKLMIRKREGVILNISSVVGVYGNPGQANYAASKAGLIGLTKTMAKEFGSRNIRVNALAPGFIESDMTDKLPDTLKEEALKKLSIKRFGKTEEVAALALFLASQEASYITGQTLCIDGGIAL